MKNCKLMEQRHWMAAPELFINSEEELNCNAMRELVRPAETNKTKGS
jgi:hypothetical protein